MSWVSPKQNWCEAHLCPGCHPQSVSHDLHGGLCKDETCGCKIDTEGLKTKPQIFGDGTGGVLAALRPRASIDTRLACTKLWAATKGNMDRQRRIRLENGSRRGGLTAKRWQVSKGHHGSRFPPFPNLLTCSGQRCHPLCRPKHLGTVVRWARAIWVREVITLPLQVW